VLDDQGATEVEDHDGVPGVHDAYPVFGERAADPESDAAELDRAGVADQLDPDLFRQGHDLVTGKLSSSGSPDSYQVLKEKFNARYVFLAKPFDDSLYFRLWADPRFSLRKENQYSVVFEVN